MRTERIVSENNEWGPLKEWMKPVPLAVGVQRAACTAPEPPVSLDREQARAHRQLGLGLEAADNIAGAVSEFEAALALGITYWKVRTMVHTQQLEGGCFDGKWLVKEESVRAAIGARAAVEPA